MAELPELRNPAPHIEHRILRALETEREERTKERSLRPPSLALSGVGKCVRELWAGMQGVGSPDPIEPRVLAIFDFGNTVEEHVIRLLRRAGELVIDVDPFTGEQFRVVDFDGKASGRLDGKIDLGPKGSRTVGLLEIKSANDKQFAIAADVGIHTWQPKYVDQATYYMGLAKLDVCLFVVFGKNDSQIYSEKIRFDPERFHRLRQKVATAVLSPTLPDRPAEATSQYCNFCKWCEVNEWCWSATAGVQFDE